MRSPDGEVHLADEWQAASCEPDAHIEPATIDGLVWLPASVPGTAAGALAAAGRWRLGESIDLDHEDWWFRTRFVASPGIDGERVLLCLDGIATVAEVHLNGRRLLESDSMFDAHVVDVGGLLDEGGNELAIRCRALAPLLAQKRKPRARWRQRLVPGGMRFQRAMMLGRAPGFAPGPQAVGPWRPVRLVRDQTALVERVSRYVRLEADRGRVELRARLHEAPGHELRSARLCLTGPGGPVRAPLSLDRKTGCTLLQGTVSLREPALWWPHTHGEPSLYGLSIEAESAGGKFELDAGRVGFRTLVAGANPSHDVEQDGIDLHVNGVQVFARGAIWTPIDLVGLAPDRVELHASVARVREAGMNMLRIPGTSAYEADAFHDACDELGVMVWQDFMFANLDYPIGDAGFRALVEREADQVLGAVSGRPSLTVLCGNSEVEQQVAMLGLDPALGRGELFGDLLPAAVAEHGSDAIYLPSAPCGGKLPFRSDSGVANYFGVGGYMRPLEDVRRARVRFASECLAFANVPGDEAVARLLGRDSSRPGDLSGAAWKQGVPRDVGAGWDFEDVRDHYLGLLFDLDPDELREADPDRYLELSRVAGGEVMAAVFGEWRRLDSRCGGALVLWLRDVLPGAGWGLLDSEGCAKAPFHHLRRALAPTAVWMTDEGLNGIAVHVAHDRPESLAVRLRVTLYREGEHPVAEADEQLELEPHSGVSRDVEGMLGRFVDASWAYRFGPPAQSLIVATLEGAETFSEAFHFPAARPLERESAERLGLGHRLLPAEEDGASLALSSTRFLYGARLESKGLEPLDNSFSLAPGGSREVLLRRIPGVPKGGAVILSALNLEGRLTIQCEEPEG